MLHGEPAVHDMVALDGNTVVWPAGQAETAGSQHMVLALKPAALTAILPPRVEPPFDEHVPVVTFTVQAPVGLEPRATAEEFWNWFCCCHSIMLNSE